MTSLKAYLLRKNRKGIIGAIEEIHTDQLPDDEVNVSVRYSSLNYKDGLILNGIGNLVKKYPHVPGIDFVGTVIDSKHSDFSPGDWVIGTGFRIGETRWGGYSQQVAANADELVHLPKNISPFYAMGLGAAGLTAAIALEALEKQGLTPDAGEILITGACGGVGTFSILLFAAQGYRVVASTGRMEYRDQLIHLGAKEVIQRSELNKAPERPLKSARWAGCVDTVGGTTLANVLSSMDYGSSIASVGLADSSELTTSVIPFLLRSVNIIGVDSVFYPIKKRPRLWDQLGNLINQNCIRGLLKEADLNQLNVLGKKILRGQIHGRVVIKIAD